ncbi:YtxH domain-containing protein [Paenibacillus woosongensis]|uniref:YtxH domain-containing protein n=1 Tax=Paenibacillus woosongensis TaxID=307580 RepID=A0AA95I6H4_9BACL|nr:YtxH domain-containing protein [Paenibacillus woosongensis]WHX48424.1 YtxH domain-containing protein [Paenibacillus woosongensis]
MNKEEMDCQVQSGSTFTKGLVIGALLGAAAALLYAPKPGRELRSDLTEKLSAATDKSKEVAAVVGEKATDLAKNVTEKTTDLAKTVSESAGTIFNSAKEASADVAEDVKRASDDVMNEAKQS